MNARERDLMAGVQEQALMKVGTELESHSIRFQVVRHQPEALVIIHGKPRLVKGEIGCIIRTGDGVEFHARSWCSHSDVWDEWEGKKVAFDRTLHDWVRYMRGVMWTRMLEGRLERRVGKRTGIGGQRRSQIRTAAISAG